MVRRRARLHDEFDYTKQLVADGRLPSGSRRGAGPRLDEAFHSLLANQGDVELVGRSRARALERESPWSRGALHGFR